MSSIIDLEDLSIRIDTNEVVCRGETVKLTPKEMGVLSMLLDQSDATVTRIQLLEKVWGDRLANNQGLTQAVSKIRKTLAGSNVMIRTIPKKGYQLCLVAVKREKRSRVRIKSPAMILMALLTLLFIYALTSGSIGIRVQVDKAKDPTTNLVGK